MGHLKLSRVSIVRRAEVALRELDLSVTTQADKRRIDRVRQAMRALDDEQADIKDFVANLVASIPTGYSEREVIDDLKDAARRWSKGMQLKQLHAPEHQEHDGGDQGEHDNDAPGRR